MPEIQNKNTMLYIHTVRLSDVGLERRRSKSLAEWETRSSVDHSTPGLKYYLF